MDAIREQQVKRTAQGCWCIRVGGYTGLTVEEARPQKQKLTYVSSEGRTVWARAHRGAELLRPLHREESSKCKKNKLTATYLTHGTLIDSLLHIYWVLEGGRKWVPCRELNGILSKTERITKIQLIFNTM